LYLFFLYNPRNIYVAVRLQRNVNRVMFSGNDIVNMDNHILILASRGNSSCKEKKKSSEMGVNEHPSGLVFLHVDVKVHAKLFGKLEFEVSGESRQAR
jgi:hypothetical protein